jgi:hypothetical protein
MLNFIHAIGFDQDWKDIGLTDDDLWAAQLLIQSDPTRPPVVKGTGGLRKLRFAARKKSGKRKSCRIGYAYFPDAAVVFLIVAYAKNEADDLTPADKKVIRRMIERENKVLTSRPVR